MHFIQFVNILWLAVIKPLMIGLFVLGLFFGIIHFFYTYPDTGGFIVFFIISWFIGVCVIMYLNDDGRKYGRDD